MNKLFIGFIALFASAQLFAAELSIVRSMAAGTVSNYLSGKFVVESIRIVNTSTNNATIKFYDWATAATSIVRAAYTTVNSYATNYSVIYTNSAGIVATNTHKGWYSANATVAEATSEQSRLGEFQVTLSTTRDLPFNPLVVRGLTVLSDQAGTIEIVYASIP